MHATCHGARATALHATSFPQRDTGWHVRTLTQVTHGMHCARTMMNLSTLGNFSTFELASDLMLSSSLITLRSSDGSRASPIA